jgi:hypothetical protein
LPVLDAMVPAMSVVAQTAANRRDGSAFYIPMGMNPAQWMPGAVGRSRTLTDAQLARATPRLPDRGLNLNEECQYDGQPRLAGALLGCAKAKRTEGDCGSAPPSIRSPRSRLAAIQPFHAGVGH